MSDDDRDAYVQLWFTAGTFLGIDPEHLLSRRTEAAAPLQWDEMRELRDLIAKRNAGPSESGQLLIARAPRRGGGIGAVLLERSAASMHAVSHR